MDPVSAGLQAAGKIFGGIAGLKAGKQQQAAYHQQALQTEAVGAQNEIRVRDSAREAIGNQIAGQFSNGFQGGTGSAIDYVHQSMINGALDALNVRQAALARADNSENEGAIAAAKGEDALRAGISSAFTGVQSQQADWAVAHRGQVPAGGGGKSFGGGSGYSNADDMAAINRAGASY
jgi:hypothetical protein